MKITKWFAILPLISLVMGSSLTAQTTLDRLEQQIRQRVSPIQGGNPPAYPGTPRPAIISSDKIPVTDRPESGYLGVTADDRKDRGRGVRITEVRPGSPAEKAGLRTQDLITGLEGERVRQLTELTEMLVLYKAGEDVEFDIIRDGTPQKIKVTLGRRSAPPAQVNQTTERIPLPPGELIIPDPAPGKITPPPVNSRPPTDREIIEQMRSRIAELERQVAELERALAEERQKNK
jgi:membrane-associated protease RseP (regulator of RpoE activity)